MVSRKAGIFKDNWGITGNQCWDGTLFISEDLQSSADYMRQLRQFIGWAWMNYRNIFGLFPLQIFLGIVLYKHFVTNPPKEINIMDMYFSARTHLSYSCPSKRKSIKSPLTNKRSIWYNLYTLIREPQLNIWNETQAAVERDCGCTAPVAESASGAEKADIEGFWKAEPVHSFIKDRARDHLPLIWCAVYRLFLPL